MLIDRSDTGLAILDIEFNYGTIAWETGAVSAAAITSPVPLPAARWLLTAGLGGLAAMCRRNCQG